MYLTLIKTLLWLNILFPAIISSIYLLKLVEIILPYISERGLKNLSMEVKKQWRKNRSRIFLLFQMYCTYLTFMIMTPFFTIPEGRTTLTSNRLLDVYIAMIIFYMLYSGIRSGIADLKNISINFNVSIMTVTLDLRKISERVENFRTGMMKFKFLRKFQKIEEYIEEKIEDRILEEITSEESIQTLFAQILYSLLRGYCFLIFSMILHEYRLIDIGYPLLAVLLGTGILYYLVFREKNRYGSSRMDEFMDEFEICIEQEKNQKNRETMTEIMERLKEVIRQSLSPELKGIVLLVGRTQCGKTALVRNIFKDEYLGDIANDDFFRAYNVNDRIYVELEKLGSPEFKLENFKRFMEGKCIDSILFFHDSTEVSGRIKEEVDLIVALTWKSYRGVIPILTKIDNVSPSREPISSVSKWGNIKRIESELIRYIKLCGLENPQTSWLTASDPEAPDFWHGIKELREYILDTNETTCLKQVIEEVRKDRKKYGSQSILKVIEELKKFLEQSRGIDSDFGRHVVDMIEDRTQRSE